MQVQAIPALKDNYIWYFTDNKTHVIVDPAVSEPVINFLQEHSIHLDYIINTHHHYDHVDGNIKIKNFSKCKIIGPSYDKGRIPGMDKAVSDGQHIALGNMSAQVLYVPGHTSGHIAFWFAQDAVIFCGDTLFSLGCGRLFEGTATQLWQSLLKLKALPPETKVYCTHEYTLDNARFAMTVDKNNPDLQTKLSWIEKTRKHNQPTLPSTLGEEFKLNPFLRPENENIRRRLGMLGPKYSDADVFTKLRTLKDSF